MFLQKSRPLFKFLNRRKKENEQSIIVIAIDFEHVFITCQFLTFPQTCLEIMCCQGRERCIKNMSGLWNSITCLHIDVLGIWKVNHVTYIKIKNKEEGICMEFLGFLL